MRPRAQGFAALLMCALGCPAQPPPPHAEPAFGHLDLRRCRPAPGTTGRPRTIAEAVRLIDGLPEPVTAACLVEALDRPLHIELSRSGASAQPARGARSPRVFIFSGEDLVITVVAAGPGRDLVEFGETVAPGRTVKGELEFPLSASLTHDAPFERVRNPEHGNITTCFVCHDAEQEEPGFEGGRSSLALRPRTASLVDIATLDAAYIDCDRTKEAKRCEMLRALVPWGPLVHRSFDESLPTF